MGCAVSRYAVEGSCANLDLRDLTIKVARPGGGPANLLYAVNYRFDTALAVIADLFCHTAQNLAFHVSARHL